MRILILAIFTMAFSVTASAQDLSDVNGEWMLTGGTGTKFKIKKDGSMWVEASGYPNFFSQGRVEHLGGERYIFHLDANPNDPCHVKIYRLQSSSTPIGINGTRGGAVSCVQLFRGEARRVFSGDDVNSLSELAGEWTTVDNGFRNVTVAVDGRFSHGNFGAGKIRHVKGSEFELTYDEDGSRDAGRKCKLWIKSPDIAEVITTSNSGAIECQLGLLRRRATGATTSATPSDSAIR